MTPRQRTGRATTQARSTAQPSFTTATPRRRLQSRCVGVLLHSWQAVLSKHKLQVKQEMQQTHWKQAPIVTEIVPAGKWW